MENIILMLILVCRCCCLWCYCRCLVVLMVLQVMHAGSRILDFVHLLLTVKNLKTGWLLALQHVAGWYSCQLFSLKCRVNFQRSHKNPVALLNVIFVLQFWAKFRNWLTAGSVWTRSQIRQSSWSHWPWHPFQPLFWAYGSIWDKNRLSCLIIPIIRSSFSQTKQTRSRQSGRLEAQGSQVLETRSKVTSCLEVLLSTFPRKVFVWLPRTRRK